GEVETGDAAAGAAPLLAFTTDDDGRAIKFLEHARGNDPDHADVPEQLAFHDDEIGVGIELGADGADDFVNDAAFDFLAFAISRVERLRDGRGFGFVAR